MRKKYKVVIFDMDGTFLDSRGVGETPYEWAYEAFRTTLRHYGITLTIKEIDDLFLAPLHSEGEVGVREVRGFCNRFGLDCEEFWARRERDVIEAKINAIRRGEITLCKGSEAVIKYLSKNAAWLAVVSDSQQACVDYALEHFGLTPYFKIWYGRQSELASLAKRKPSPFYINLVLSELGLSSERGRESAVLVDDSPVGILAAKRAGIDSVFIFRGGKAEELRENWNCEPTFLVGGVEDLEGIL
ncbi:MAG TPA: HAD family hydrolase [Methanomicrobia archaeon]|nr:HAD family hydrolase [Methanomicrobia archaeon]